MIKINKIMVKFFLKKKKKLLQTVLSTRHGLFGATFKQIKNKNKNKKRHASLTGQSKLGTSRWAWPGTRHARPITHVQKSSTNKTSIF